ncbi:SDR family oxidoreductase (plasmid) [Pseudomonas luteola]|uniref:SDR family NAD(P)-dependent oxidoreductase n=1 Tax=Pseudomonas luteola TaxID=47886 RepID=UPI00388F876E
MKINLENKKVIITGAANGIGRATALAFAREGCVLALLDYDLSELQTLSNELEILEIENHIIEADLSTSAGVELSFSSAIDSLGNEVDILVNNVGTGAVRHFDEITDEQWQQTLDLNFMSYVRACRKVLPLMRAQKSGVIINNASDLARQPEPNPLDYSASKAAVLALTKGLARSEGPDIRINAVAPGPIWTPFWTKPGGFADTLSHIHNLPPQEAVRHEMSLRHLPLGRLGTPDEVANVIVFLSSDLASFVTSSVWGVDGGSIRSII